MRNLVDVIDKMLPLIPDTEDILVSSLKSLQKSSACGAPEIQHIFWNEAYEVITDVLMFNPHDRLILNGGDGWKKSVLGIFSDKEITSDFTVWG